MTRSITRPREASLIGCRPIVGEARRPRPPHLPYPSSCKRDCPRGCSETFIKIAALPQNESGVLDGVDVKLKEERGDGARLELREVSEDVAHKNG